MDVLRKLKGILNTIPDSELDEMDLDMDYKFAIIEEIRISSGAIELITNEYREKQLSIEKNNKN